MRLLGIAASTLITLAGVVLAAPGAALFAIGWGSYCAIAKPGHGPR